MEVRALRQERIRRSLHLADYWPDPTHLAPGAGGGGGASLSTWKVVLGENKLSSRQMVVRVHPQEAERRTVNLSAVKLNIILGVCPSVLG